MRKNKIPRCVRFRLTGLPVQDSPYSGKAKYSNFVYEETSQLFGMKHKLLPWSRGSVLEFGTGRSRRIFQDEIILSTPSFGREVKPFFPCRRFTSCKISLNVTWKSDIFRKKFIGHFSPKYFLLSLVRSLVETPGNASRKD